jgi:hypothetical protein
MRWEARPAILLQDLRYAVRQFWQRGEHIHFSLFNALALRPAFPPD